MKAEELEAIRNRAEDALCNNYLTEFASDGAEVIEKDIPKLLEEIERLRTKLNIYASTLREIETLNEYYSGTAAARALDEVGLIR